MKIPLSWISLYSPLASLHTKYKIKELAHEYSTHTAEIDGIEEHFLEKVVVGKVISCEKHPESKKLSIVRVALGIHGEETILTGAPNISEATYVPVAMVGAVLPGDFTIGERMMAGMMSRGMICGADEIGMSTEESTGIMILEDDWSKDILEGMIGKSFFDLTLSFPDRKGKVYQFPLRDTTFEIDNKFITNRPDLFSVIGNAREFHAVFETPLTPYDGKVLESDNTLSVRVESDKLRAMNFLVTEGISVGKSPFGISLMMERAGLAPKMDIVDITNIIMTELGQPMHAFDADTISGAIVIRMAKEGEKLLALNGVEYSLTSDDLIIADDLGPLSLAGIIGGARSAVSLETKNVIWESGNFDPTSVRLSTQRHAIRTDASTRFEKSLDPTQAGKVFDRVLEYLRFLGKEVNPTKSFSYLDHSQVRTIDLEVSRDFIVKKAGRDIDTPTILGILSRLGFQVKEAGEIYSISVPSWRATKDITIKEDIAEEIIRVVGYDTIPLTALPLGQSILEKNSDRTLRDMTLDHFRGEKWHEVYTYSFTNETLDKKTLFSDMENALSIRNAFNEEYTHMRRSLAPRLLMAVAENLKHGKNMSFFEIGKTYSKSKGEGELSPLLKNIEKLPFPEKKKIAGVSTGKTIAELRSVLESYLREVLGYVPPVHSGSGLTLFHPNASGQYVLGEKVLVRFGIIHPEVASRFSVPEDTLYFEADFEILLEEMKNRDTRFDSISRYQTIPRELNFIMNSHTPTGDVARILDAIHPWIHDISVASVYEDVEKVGEGRKSVNFAFTLSNKDATISDDEALSVQNLIIEEMAKHGYFLRSI